MSCAKNAMTITFSDSKNMFVAFKPKIEMKFSSENPKKITPLMPRLTYGITFHESNQRRKKTHIAFV